MDGIGEGVHGEVHGPHDREPHVVLLDCGFGGMYVGEPLGPCCRDIFKEQIKTETTWSTKVSNEIAVENLLFASWAYHSQAMQGGEQTFLQRMSALAERS